MTDEARKAMEAALVSHLRVAAEREGWFEDGWLGEKGEVSLDVRDLHVPGVIDALLAALSAAGYAVVPRDKEPIWHPAESGPKDKVVLAYARESTIDPFRFMLAIQSEWGRWWVALDDSGALADNRYGEPTEVTVKLWTPLPSGPP